MALDSNVQEVNVLNFARTACLQRLPLTMPGSWCHKCVSVSLVTASSQHQAPDVALGDAGEGNGQGSRQRCSGS